VRITEAMPAGWTKQSGVYKRRWFLVVALILLALGAWAAPAAAAPYEQVDSLPKINSFASARFDLLTTIEIGELKQQVAFGKGEVILPDRAKIWVGVNGSDQLIYVVQIGTTTYVNDGTGWKRTDNIPVDNVQGLPLAEQIVRLQEKASAVLKVGAEPVRGAPATHYQVWLSGANALEIVGNSELVTDEVRDLISQFTFKYDFWIGDQDGLLYQQNVVVITPDSSVSGIDLPAASFSTLLTFYDFNDPSISIQPPI
jgi:hypothetical protein